MNFISIFFLKIQVIFSTSAIDFQVPARIGQDFSNKSAATGATLSKTFSYLAARNMAQINGADLLMLYNLVRIKFRAKNIKCTYIFENIQAYVKAQYLNEKVVLVDSQSKKIRSTAEKGLWMGLYKRMQVINICTIEL